MRGERERSATHQKHNAIEGERGREGRREGAREELILIVKAPISYLHPLGRLEDSL